MSLAIAAPRPDGPACRDRSGIASHRRARAGRIIGGAGAICATLVWGVLLVACTGMLIDPPRGAAGLVVVVALPMAVFASVLLIVALAGAIVLARRVDVGMPQRVAWTHAVMAVVLWFGGPGDARAWIAPAVLLAIAATQWIALRLFAQMTPSQASSQR